jgi:NADPH-dependent ferric siderophore reductase
VLVEVADPAARLALPEHPGATVEWLDLPIDATAGDALFTAIVTRDLAPGTRVWVAGEAAGVQRIRRHLFEERSWPRREATVRGYWKHGRRGDG